MENNTLPPIYAPLDSTRREIRLLELLPAPADDETLVSCTISVVSLDDQPDYAALSYVWGDASITSTILLNGVQTTVTGNLAAALQHLPRNRSVRSYLERKGVFRIWADAICIDQGNVEERNQQVALMADLYSSADHVFSWLGTANFIPKAIQTLGRILAERIRTDIDTLTELQWLRQYPELYEVNIPPEEGHVLIPNQCWEAVRDFIHLPYWSRMWIFQEIILSGDEKLTFVSDGVCIRDTPLRAALSCLREIGSNIRRQTRPEFISEDRVGVSSKTSYSRREWCTSQEPSVGQKSSFARDWGSAPPAMHSLSIRPRRAGYRPS
jgi:hypothetical protein